MASVTRNDKEIARNPRPPGGLRAENADLFVAAPRRYQHRLVAGASISTPSARNNCHANSRQEALTEGEPA